jgi:hypothetical protein
MHESGELREIFVHADCKGQAKLIRCYESWKIRIWRQEFYFKLGFKLGIDTQGLRELGLIADRTDQVRELDNEDLEFTESKYDFVARQVLVAHACNPSYSGGRDQGDHGLKPAGETVHEIMS